jgi:hypothetical protein
VNQKLGTAILFQNNSLHQKKQESFGCINITMVVHPGLKPWEACIQEFDRTPLQVEANYAEQKAFFGCQISVSRKELVWTNYHQVEIRLELSL